MKPKYSVRDLILISLFAALTAVMAYVSIPLPFSPVPLSGQTFAVMLAGVLLGARKGAFSQIIYLLLGVAGIPVFAGGYAGISRLAGPTGGFIWGFVIGAYIIGKLVEGEKCPSMARLVAAVVVGGIIAVYLPGILQLAYVTGMAGRQAAVAMLPYIPGDLVKVAAASVLAKQMLSIPIFNASY